VNRRIQKSPDFTADFQNLFGWYIDRAGVDVAWRFQVALDISLMMLSSRPDLGRLRHFRNPILRGLRSFPVERPFGSILIFYRTGDTMLDAYRLLHGDRDLPRRLRETPPI
jgi:plasmid stabilization system protein ParE